MRHQSSFLFQRRVVAGLLAVLLAGGINRLAAGTLTGAFSPVGVSELWFDVLWSVRRRSVAKERGWHVRG